VLVPPVGLDPTPHDLKGRCSSTELRRPEHLPAVLDFVAGLATRTPHTEVLVRHLAFAASPGAGAWQVGAPGVRVYGQLRTRAPGGGRTELPPAVIGDVPAPVVTLRRITT